MMEAFLQKLLNLLNLYPAPVSKKLMAVSRLIIN
jgi:hypothetical protein